MIKENIRKMLWLCCLLTYSLNGQTEKPEEPVIEEDELAAIEASLGGVVKTKAPSENATINLVRLLVKRGVLTNEDAVDLIRQAEAEARLASEQKDAIAVAQKQIEAVQPKTPESDDDIRVTYVPGHVRNEIAADVRHELEKEFSSRGWDEGKDLPEWVARTRFSGDFRLRYETIGFSDDNNNTGVFLDFNGLNNRSSPLDITDFDDPLLFPNVDERRNRSRVRARLGVESDLGDNFTLGMRFATGSGDSPVSTNQTMGDDFSKYNVWLDRAFLKWELNTEYFGDWVISGGRFDNPFFTTNMMWDSDVALDGFAVQMNYDLFDGNFTPYITAGAFPYYNTSLNFPNNNAAKFDSEDRWLFAGQIGFDAQVTKNIDVKFGAAYYRFDNIEGKLSDPFSPFNSSDAGSTDHLRPAFAQTGNSYMFLRDIVATATNNFGTTDQFQYFGLASAYNIVSLGSQVDFNFFEPIQFSIFGEAALNIGFDRTEIQAETINNVEGVDDEYYGGDLAWIAGFKVGNPVFEERWDWNLTLNYRYVESDALLDAFVDSDFGLGGTNLKGFSLEGNVAFSERVWLGFAWLSASEVKGPIYKSDIFQFDLSAEF